MMALLASKSGGIMQLLQLDSELCQTIEEPGKWSGDSLWFYAIKYEDCVEERKCDH